MAMFSQHDIDAIEGEEDVGYVEQIKSLQRAVNSGMWGLQGSYGRAMMAAIERGEVMLGVNDSRDYYGSHIPSRTQVQEGTKGSRQYVVDRHGEPWAVMLEGV